jgi:hypothetical protein
MSASHGEIGASIEKRRRKKRPGTTRTKMRKKTI